MAHDHRHEERRSRARPETLRLRAVCPVLTVADLQSSLSWYCDVVGFTLAETWERDGAVAGVALVAGSERLILVQRDDVEGGQAVGVRLDLRTAQDVDMLAEGVRARGGRVKAGPHSAPSGGRSFEVVDPDGLVLTISSER